MLSPADNELLTSIVPGTPMGELYRRFWIPVMRVSEIAEPDGPQVRLKILGEELIAFRDTEGRVGLVEAYCKHRRAPLFFGRNEKCGLRCVFHGWKYDVTGQCVEIPNAAEGEEIKHLVKLTAYPTQEHGGLVWAYMGPAEKRPPFPYFPWFDVPDSHRHLARLTASCNWFQVMEADVDSSHLSFLHSRVDAQDNAGLDVRLKPALMKSRVVHWDTRDTDYGIRIAARRDVDERTNYWRINHFLLPNCVVIAGPPDHPMVVQIRVPMDDTNTLHFRVYAHLDRPLTAEERNLSGNLFPELDPVTGRMKESRDNDYLMDRGRQKRETFTGIQSVVAQDLAVTEYQGGPISDRSKEFLTSSDGAIVAVRRRLIEAAKSLAVGREPPEAQVPEAYRVRGTQFTLPKEADVEVGLRKAAAE